jgi:septum formation protein
MSAQEPERLALILASASPRRFELMRRFWPDRLLVRAPLFDEAAAAAACAPEGSALARYLPVAKLRALQAQADLPPRYVAVAADTLVCLGTRIFGKPADAAQARAQLRQLSGRTHRVLTGLAIALHEPGRTEWLQTVEETTVRFAKLDEERIAWYVSTGEPLDKAGSYGIQGAGAALVERIDGCYYNVMGLPVYRLFALLGQAARQDLFAGLTDLLPWNGIILPTGGIEDV